MSGTELTCKGINFPKKAKINVDKCGKLYFEESCGKRHYFSEKFCCKTSTVTVGTTTTLPPGSNAYVTETRTQDNVILNFGLVTGDTGITPSFSIGTTETLPAGSDAFVNQTGTAENPIFNFGLVTGATGAIGYLNYSDFYALMPNDNASTVAVGSFVQFPQNGPSNGIIVRTADDIFILPNIGVYEINFQVSVTEAGQLGIIVNDDIIPYSIVGRATGTSQLIGLCLVETSSINALLSIVNPAGNSKALTITPLAGGASPVSAHLVIKQIA